MWNTNNNNNIWNGCRRFTTHISLWSCYTNHHQHKQEHGNEGEIKWTLCSLIPAMQDYHHHQLLPVHPSIQQTIHPSTYPPIDIVVFLCSISAAAPALALALPLGVLHPLHRIYSAEINLRRLTIFQFISFHFPQFPCMCPTTPPCCSMLLHADPQQRSLSQSDHSLQQQQQRWQHFAPSIPYLAEE